MGTWKNIGHDYDMKITLGVIYYFKNHTVFLLIDTPGANAFLK
jgi:hypothetical protein